MMTLTIRAMCLIASSNRTRSIVAFVYRENRTEQNRTVSYVIDVISYDKIWSMDVVVGMS